MPVLGICRGMQMLNVAAGGTLEQHLPDGSGTPTTATRPAPSATTRCALEPGSLAARAADAERLAVKSHHHQGADELGEGVTPTGWADRRRHRGGDRARRPCATPSACSGIPRRT